MIKVKSSKVEKILKEPGFDLFTFSEKLNYGWESLLQA